MHQVFSRIPVIMRVHEFRGGRADHGRGDEHPGQDRHIQAAEDEQDPVVPVRFPLFRVQRDWFQPMLHQPEHQRKRKQAEDQDHGRRGGPGPEGKTAEECPARVEEQSRRPDGKRIQYFSRAHLFSPFPSVVIPGEIRDICPLSVRRIILSQEHKNRNCSGG